MEKIIKSWHDDLDDTEAVYLGVTVALGSKTVRLDLSEENYGKLTAFLKPYLDNGEEIRGLRSASSKVRRDMTRTEVPSSAATARKWLEAHGYTVPKKGRLPRELREAYERKITKGFGDAVASPKTPPQEPTEAPASAERDTQVVSINKRPSRATQSAPEAPSENDAPPRPRRRRRATQ